jgi:tetratricopeptide (TPR) repeat protein
MTNESPTPELPFLIERLMRESARQFENEDYASEDDFRENMQDLIDEGLSEKRREFLKNDPVEMAQELAFQGFESEDIKEAQKLVEQALELDPECVDALTIHAFLTSEDAADLIERIEHAASCAENRLGEDFFSEFLGDFWPMVEARPYMRTIKQLAQVLWMVGRRFDAVENYQNLLELDPSDHLGNSVLLLGCYLNMGEVQRSWDLLEEYDDDQGALFQWAWVLIFLMAEDEDAAEDALKHALDMNDRAVPHLLGMIEPVEQGFSTMAPGSEEEAVLCGQILGDAWNCKEENILWLQQQLLEKGVIELEDDDDLEDDSDD